MFQVQLKRRSATRSVVRIYFGPPGTGKTLTAVRLAVKLADPGFDDKGSPELAFSRFNELRDRLAFVTFHQALQYEDVVESIRPRITTREDLISNQQEPSAEDDVCSNAHLNEAALLTYQLHEGILLRTLRRAIAEPDSEFVVVIDEINRGDISRILGPLISSLEPDKRLGAEFPLGVELQYPRSAELESRLFMPPNLHLLGTMNSSDRNIALVDHALRRRFDFVECPPEPSLLSSTEDQEALDLNLLLETINKRIQHLLDRDHCIGHGYLMGTRTNLEVVERFAKKILPLLREYFYGNEGLVLLVLGDRPGGQYNIHRIHEPEQDLVRLFQIEREEALNLGYRPQEVGISISIDPKFWNASLPIPAPDDAVYAFHALKKIYEGASSQH